MSQVNQNFTDIINGTSDGTKDFSISALTCAGNATFNGNTTIGNASGDTITMTGSVASHVNPSAHNTYDFGTVTTLGWRAFYFASSSATKTAKVIGPATSSDIIITLPSATGTLHTENDNASQADQETGTSTTKLVTPGVQKYHPLSAKAWGSFDGTAGTPSVVSGSAGVSSITDNGTGSWKANWSTAFSAGSYICLATCNEPSAIGHFVDIAAVAGALDTAGAQLRGFRHDNTAADLNNVSFVAYGDV